MHPVDTPIRLIRGWQRLSPGTVLSPSDLTLTVRDGLVRSRRAVWVLSEPVAEAKPRQKRYQKETVQ